MNSQMSFDPETARQVAYYRKLLAKNGLLLGGVVLLAVILAGAALLFQPKEFTAEADVLVHPPLAATNLSPKETPLKRATYESFFRNQGLTSQLVRKLGLDGSPWYVSGIALYHRIKVWSVPDSDIIKIQVLFPDASMAATLLNALVESGVTLAQKRRDDDFLQYRDQLMEETRIAKERLDALEKDYQELLLQIPVESLRLKRTSLAQLEGSLMEKRQESALAMEEKKAAAAMTPEQFDALAAKLPPEEIDYWRKASLRAPLELVGLTARLSAIDARLTALSASLQEVESSLAEGEVRFGGLRAKLDTFREQYLDLLRAFQAADASAGLTRAGVEVLDRALANPAPLTKPSFRKVLLAAFLAFGAGLVYVLGRDYLRRVEGVVNGK